MKNRKQALDHLLRAFALTNKVGRFRCVLIGILFPEFEQIMGELAGLSGIVEDDNKPDRDYV